MRIENAKRDYLPSLTGLRGISCLLVILCHCSNLEILSSGALSGFGTPAVYFFFVLSGYLLMSRALSEIQSSHIDHPTKFWGASLTSFLIKRIARIYPPYFVSIWFYYALVSLAKYCQHQELILQEFDRPLWATFFFEGMESHLWTISNEWYFYVIVLPIILTLASIIMIWDYKSHRSPKSSFVLLFYLLITICVSLQQYLIGNVETGYPSRHDFRVHLPAFWHGSLAGIAGYYSRYYHSNQKQIIGKCFAEVLVWTLLLRLVLGNSNIMSFYTNYDPQVWWNNSLLVSPFASSLLFILDITDGTTSLARITSLSIFRKMGEVSYSTYLVHISVIIIFKWSTDIRGIIGILTVTIISFVVGLVMYYLIEKKAEAYGKRLVKYLSEEDIVDRREFVEESNNKEKVEISEYGKESVELIVRESHIYRIIRAIIYSNNKKACFRGIIYIILVFFSVNSIILGCTYSNTYKVAV